MIKATRTRLLWLMLLVAVGCSWAMWLWPNTNVLICLRSFQVTSAVAVVHSYRWSLVQVWRAGRKVDDELLLTAAIVIGYAMTGASAFWLYLWRSADEPRWMVDASINGYFVAVAGWCAMVYATAPGTECGRLTKYARRYILWVFIATIMMAAIGLTSAPLFRRITDTLEPWMSEDSKKIDIPIQWLKDHVRF